MAIKDEISAITGMYAELSTVKCARCGDMVLLNLKELDLDSLNGWGHIEHIGRLCPVCTEQWKSTVEKFKQGQTL